MWARFLSFAICFIVPTNVFCDEYQPLLDDHGGTAAVHISDTDLSSTTQRCGAILISDRHLLTAATCVKGKEYERLVSISLGREDLDQNPIFGENSYRIQNIAIHPDFVNGRREYSDLAILETDRKVEYSKKVWPYCLPEQNQRFTPFKSVVIAGWGFISPTLKTSKLHAAYVSLMPIPHCESEWRQHAPQLFLNITQYTYPEGLDERIICAGRMGVDACIGDSGGPMTFQNKYGKHTLIGLIAKRTECPDQPKTPGFYTNIAHYVDWIYDTTSHSQQSLSTNCGGPPRPNTTQNDLEADIEANGSEIGLENGADDGQTDGDEVFAGDSGNTPVDVRSGYVRNRNKGVVIG